LKKIKQEVAWKEQLWVGFTLNKKNDRQKGASELKFHLKHYQQQKSGKLKTFK